MGAATKSPDIGDNRLQPYRSHLGNATPKGGLAFFWESFIIIFLNKIEKSVYEHCALNHSTSAQALQ